MTDLIECDECGRSFATERPAEMLAAIKGPCPVCGGTFRLAHAPADPGPSRPAHVAPRSAS
jgi:rRNA maturation protein Nop10